MFTVGLQFRGFSLNWSQTWTCQSRSSVTSRSPDPAGPLVAADLFAPAPRTATTPCLVAADISAGKAPRKTAAPLPVVDRLFSLSCTPGGSIDGSSSFSYPSWHSQLESGCRSLNPTFKTEPYLDPPSTL